MSGYRKHPSGPGYQVRVYPFPAETFATEDEAAVRAAQLREYRRAGVRNLAQVEASARMTLEEAAAGYYTGRLARPGRYGKPLTEKTRKAVARRLAFWTERFGSLPVAWLNRGKCEDAYSEVAATRPAEAQDLRRELLNVLEWAQGRGEPVPPALMALPHIRVSHRERKAMTLEDVETLVSHAPEYARDTLRFLASVGGRQGETFKAEPSWFDLKAATWTVPDWACKERRTKVIALTPDEVAIVRRQLLRRAAGARTVFCGRDGAEWSTNHFHALVWRKALLAAREAYVEAHGVGPTPFDGLRPHDLRSTAATLMRDAGLPLEVAAARLGHKDGGWLLVTTYKKTSAEAQRAALEAAGYGTGGSARKDSRSANPGVPPTRLMEASAE